jgi:Na+-dependent transporters of the SNF family
MDNRLFFKSLTFKFNNISQDQLNVFFSETVSSNFEPLIFLLIFLVVTALIVIAGIEKGIEKYSKIMMPVLFAIVIIIAIRSMTLPNAQAGIDFLFKPDFSKVTSNMVLDAMGQAFFSLSLGMGCILTYGSYVNKRENIVKTSFLTSISDTGFALIAGLAIMPAVFAFGIAPSEGPGLVFVILPHIFQQIPFGSFLAIIFFFALFIAAITSSISLFEVVVAYLKEEFKLSRYMSVFITFAICLFFGTFCSLSQGSMSEFKILGFNIFDFFDYLSSNILLPLGGILIVLFVGWRMKKEDFLDELTSGGTIHFKKWFLVFTRFIIKYLAPIIIGIIMIRGLI